MLPAKVQPSGAKDFNTHQKGQKGITVLSGRLTVTSTKNIRVVLILQPEIRDKTLVWSREDLSSKEAGHEHEVENTVSPWAAEINVA